MDESNVRSPLLPDPDRVHNYGQSETSEDDFDVPNSVQQSPKHYTVTPSDSETDPTITTYQRRDKLSGFVFMLTLLSAIGGFLFGYDTGVVSGAMLLLREEFKLDALRQELVVSITILAAALFAVVGGFSNDWLGRKPTILLASFVFTLGSVLLAVALNTAMLLAGRFIVGMGIGMASMTVPMYIAESSPTHIRGRLVTLNQIFITGGQLVASLVDGAFSSDERNGWRYMLGLAAVPAFIQFVGFLFMPESPRWLVQKGREEEGLMVLRKIRGKATVEAELEEVKAACEEIKRNQATGGSSVILRIFRTPHIRKALIVGCGLQLFQQICGINTVMYYSATIIKMSGVRSASAAIWLSSVVAATNFVFSFVGLYLVDRIGRRSLTLASMAGVMMSLAFLAMSFQLAAVRSPPITYPSPEVNGSSLACQTYGSCNSCMEDSECGFCYVDVGSSVVNGSCAPVQVDKVNAVDYRSAMFGRCEASSLDKHPHTLVWAYEYCPTNVSWMPLAGLILYLICFAPGMGPMPWTINSEIYPLWARSSCIAMATAINWVSNLAISMTFLTLIKEITRYGAFWLYTGFSFMGLLFLTLVLPETKGRSLEQVELLFKRPWCSRSGGHKPYRQSTGGI